MTGAEQYLKLKFSPKLNVILQLQLYYHMAVLIAPNSILHKFNLFFHGKAIEEACVNINGNTGLTLFINILDSCSEGQCMITRSLLFFFFPSWFHLLLLATSHWLGYLWEKRGWEKSITSQPRVQRTTELLVEHRNRINIEFQKKVLLKKKIEKIF